MDRHHIIPKHAGGSDDPSNIIEVTRPQHAELHFALYLEHGRIGDFYAAHMLAGHTEEAEKSRRAWVSEYRTGRKMSDETKKKMSESLKKKHAERSDWFRTKRHWYTDGEKNVISTECPPGFWRGRNHRYNQYTK